jgi:hypothetical protein
MRPVTVSISAAQSPHEVFAFLDAVGHHDVFTDHFLVDWELSGPRSAVGATARMRVKRPGPDDWLEMAVVASEPPRVTCEESVGARGRRRTRGTTASGSCRRPAPGSASSFWLEAPLIERLTGPLIRRVMRRDNQRSLRRLVEQLGRRPSSRGGIR